MALGITTAASSSVGPAASLTFSYTCSSNANRILLVQASWEDGATQSTSSVTYNGVNLSLLRAELILGTAPANGDSVWVLKESSMPVAGAYNVVITCSASVTGGISGAAFELYDADQFSSVPTATNTYLPPSDGIVSTSVTTTVNNSWVLSFPVSSFSGAGTTWSGGTNEVEISDVNNVNQSHTQATFYKIDGVAGTSVTMTDTCSGIGSRTGLIVASFAPAATDEFYLIQDDEG
jgi:hypothetical protein